jgi:pyruvate dehydrogenase E1 component beta subunit
MTVNFSLLAFDQIVNNATLLHMSGGQVHVPVVIRIGCGIGRQLAAQHSHSWEPFAHVPGLFFLQVHEDARNMLHAALQSTDPVILFEYTFLLNMEKKFLRKLLGHYHRSQSKKRGKYFDYYLRCCGL